MSSADHSIRNKMYQTICAHQHLSTIGYILKQSKETYLKSILKLCINLLKSPITDNLTCVVTGNVILVSFHKWVATWHNQQNDMPWQWRRLSSAWAVKTPFRLGGCPGWSVFSRRTCYSVGLVISGLKYIFPFVKIISNWNHAFLDDFDLGAKNSPYHTKFFMNIWKFGQFHK